MVKVRSIELNSYDENTLPTSKSKFIVFTTLDSAFRPAIDITPDGPILVVISQVNIVVFLFFTLFK
jgi:hypothetical protein